MSEGLSSSNHHGADRNKPARLPRTANIELVQRPISALTRYRRHELSDIRELSDSSRAATLRKASSALDGTQDGVPKTPPKITTMSSESSESPRYELSSDPPPPPPPPPPPAPVTPPQGLGSRAASALSLPLREVPERRSSASILAQSIAGSRQGSMQDFPSWKLPPPSASGKTIPGRGRSHSPVRRAVKGDSVTSDTVRTSPSRTFIRTAPPLDILETGATQHPRVDMRLRLPSPLFVGGGTVEGQIQLLIDGGSGRKNKLKPISISTLSIDVLGLEEINDGRKWVFLSLAAEMFDANHPPPASLVSSQVSTERDRLLWSLKPSSAAIPFCINLPLNLGPPPYLSKQAKIRYLLCPTAVVRIGNKKSIIRQVWDIQMLTVHDPEKALASLPSPLLASDSLSLANGDESQHLRLTAGLHRQTWVNGCGLFIDIHIANNSRKSVKKIQVQLEKTVLWYAHAAAGTFEKSASHLRLPQKTDSEVIKTTTIKKSKDWPGILPRSSEVRTCELTVPRGHVTIGTGRYFEIRYFVNVLVSVGHFKMVTVQLPVTLIHMNSLDIMPNALAQVAASVEAKRARTVPAAQEVPLYAPYHQGQAFTAPRRQSLERMSKYGGRGNFRDELISVATDLQHSPRRYAHHFPHHHRQLSYNMSFENIPPGRLSGAPSSHHHHVQHPSCYHCHLAFNEHSRNSSFAPPPPPKLPRLQVSTSGLGFSDAEFQVPVDSPPRKVMLSEKERKMINQQRELNVQREHSKRSHRASDADAEKAKVRTSQDGYWGWKNVAAGGVGPKLPEHGNRSQLPLHQKSASGQQRPRQGQIPSESRKSVGLPVRTRSHINPEKDGAQQVVTGLINTGRPRRITGPSERPSRSSIFGDGAGGGHAAIGRRESRDSGRRAGGARR